MVGCGRLRQARNGQGPDERIHPCVATPSRSSAVFQQPARKVRSMPQLWDRQFQSISVGVELALPSSIALIDALAAVSAILGTTHGFSANRAWVNVVSSSRRAVEVGGGESFSQQLWPVDIRRQRSSRRFLCSGDFGRSYEESPDDPQLSDADTTDPNPRPDVHHLGGRNQWRPTRNGPRDAGPPRRSHVKYIP